MYRRGVLLPTLGRSFLGCTGWRRLGGRSVNGHHNLAAQSFTIPLPLQATPAAHVRGLPPRADDRNESIGRLVGGSPRRHHDLAWLYVCSMLSGSILIRAWCLTFGPRHWLRCSTVHVTASLSHTIPRGFKQLGMEAQNASPDMSPAPHSDMSHSLRSRSLQAFRASKDTVAICKHPPRFVRCWDANLEPVSRTNGCIYQNSTCRALRHCPRPSRSPWITCRIDMWLLLIRSVGLTARSPLSSCSVLPAGC